MPYGLDTEALLALSDGHHGRTARACAVREAGGHAVKVYALEAPGRTVTERDEAAALRLARAHLELGRARGSLGLAVLIVHAGGDGDYVLISTWIEGYMSDLAVFVSPAGQPEQLRPGRVGLAPCVWEAAVLAHERDAFTRHILDGDARIADRVVAWSKDVMSGEVR
ncbi:hypothetical protein GCM10010349_42890 [Streptomyces flavofungini]|nr:hypothetical protein GCM10010349_42890 [Streptomyces flavofungini]